MKASQVESRCLRSNEGRRRIEEYRRTLSSNRSLALALDRVIDDRTRKRIVYAFRLFCAVYGYRPVDLTRTYDGPRLCYGVEPRGPQDVRLTASYEARRPTESAAEPFFRCLDPIIFPERFGGEKYPCFHSKGENVEPDWLGEIFEWVSGAHEQSVREADSVGRIPYEATLHGRFNLRPDIPYAAVAMRALNVKLRAILGKEWTKDPLKPWSGPHSCVVVATHDIDFLPISHFQTIQRYLKNVAIALACRDSRLFASIRWS